MKIYIARRGDSLYSIAKANASSVQELAAINELSDPARLSIGQAIVIPDGARPTAETEVNGYAYPNISERQPLCRNLHIYARFRGALTHWAA